MTDAPSGQTPTTAEPKLCDLIMKGGITSGVVYPSAVLALKEIGYRFSSIGGASAGAIAAAASAAAQYGELTPGPGVENRGFAALSQLQTELASPGLMTQLFRPSKKAAPAFELLLRLQETKGKFKKVAWLLYTLIIRFWIQTLAWIIATFAALAYMVSRFGGGDESSPVAWIVLSLILLVVGLLSLGGITAFRAWRLFSVHLPRNYFGIVTGMSVAKGEPPALTEWLHDKIQRCAGLPSDQPLTFGHLKEKGRDIRLSMMTTDVTFGIPIRFPRESEPAAKYQYHYSEEEFRDLFPSSVATWLREHSEEVATSNTNLHLRTLPTEDLPLIVATRMSLSFPVLLSAIPLWNVQEGIAHQHWISDGGITSNFPIHFFDAWLPTKPTFGLDLVPSRRTEDPATEAEFALFEADPYKYTRPRRRAEIGSMVGFLGQILDTMQNWRDRVQSELPGFRDRIRSIELDPNEGGLTLTMPPEVIQALIDKGTAAAIQLDERFRWDKHLMSRYRTLMHLLDREILREQGTNPGMAEVFDTKVLPLLPTAREGDPPTLLSTWAPEARTRTLGFLKAVRAWEEHFVMTAPPKPDPALRVTSKE